MRKLATIQKIKAVRPIEGADAIEVADILGWHVVVKKGEFKPGDYCVYCEIDSILPPDNKYFAFLEGKRIRTVKLRGQISQGIAFPMCVLEGYDKAFEEGDDVTDFLKITKYEPPDTLSKAKSLRNNSKWYMKNWLTRWIYEKFFYKPNYGDFPSWIRKTDETRVQVLQDVLHSHRGRTWIATEKLDGSSITFWMEKGKFHVCSRNREIFTDTDPMRITAKKYMDNIKDLPDRTVFQGEIIGEKIQGNKYKRKGYEIYVFNIINHSGSYLTYSEMRNICEALDIKIVPFAGYIRITDDVDELVNESIGYSKLNGETRREGIVVRPIENIYTDDNRFGGRLSFKVINPQFLLKYEE